MKNNKARFRGDLQVDGSIVGRDGQPIEFGGGGGFDPTVPIPELHFAGDPGDSASGMNIRWDEDLWGLVFEQPVGAGDTEVYLRNPDDHTAFTEIWSGGVGLYGHTEYSARLTVSNDYDTPSARLFGMSDAAYGVFEKWGDGTISIGSPGGQGPFAPSYIISDLDPVLWTYQHAMYPPWYAMDKYGKMSWGDGTIVPDVSLERTAPGTLEIDHILSFKDSTASIGLEDVYDDPTYTPLVIRQPADGEIDMFGSLNMLGDSASDPHWIIFDPWASLIRFRHDNDHAEIGPAPGQGNGILQLTNYGQGSGITAFSPDGTRYKLTPPNGGGAATWVAA